MYDDENYQDHLYNRSPRRNPMATASVMLGICSILLCFLIYISIPCAALSVIFAVLSRGNGKMLKKCRTAILCSIIGTVASIVATCTMMHQLFTDPQLRSMVEEYVRIYTRDPDFSLDELLNVLPFASFFIGSSDSDQTGAESETEENRVHLQMAPDTPAITSAETEDMSELYAETQTESETAVMIEADTEVMAESDTEAIAESDADTAAESDTEVITKSEMETQTEELTETTTEASTQPDTQNDGRVHLIQVGRDDN